MSWLKIRRVQKKYSPSLFVRGVTKRAPTSWPSTYHESVLQCMVFDDVILKSCQSDLLTDEDEQFFFSHRARWKAETLQRVVSTSV